jgi:hypothetical protein
MRKRKGFQLHLLSILEFEAGEISSITFWPIYLRGRESGNQTSGTGTDAVEKISLSLQRSFSPGARERNLNNGNCRY